VLIGGETLPPGIESSISTVSIAELHFGLLVAPDEDTRAVRAARLGLIEARPRRRSTADALLIQHEADS